eukprot:3679352-Rhodomonas_salina.2
MFVFNAPSPPRDPGRAAVPIRIAVPGNPLKPVGGRNAVPGGPMTPAFCSPPGAPSGPPTGRCTGAVPRIPVPGRSILFLLSAGRTDTVQRTACGNPDRCREQGPLKDNIVCCSLQVSTDPESPDTTTEELIWYVMDSLYPQDPRLTRGGCQASIQCHRCTPSRLDSTLEDKTAAARWCLQVWLNSGGNQRRLLNRMVLPAVVGGVNHKTLYGSPKQQKHPTLAPRSRSGSSCVCILACWQESGAMGKDGNPVVFFDIKIGMFKVSSASWCTEMAARNMLTLARRLGASRWNCSWTQRQRPPRTF